ncbi:hypothetical protein GIB67_007782 [Kingdonia uniflora]|uniref:Uncharacterized protein n=1 Tax=Kingdonia uniflora TaxID=39325 RepID=A0A7J7N1S2_9MAGN|nr:hypothetical protein GIB67_007782 [Kingdonia uniflora]
MKVEEGSLRSLIVLYINECTNLKMLPDSLRHVTTHHPSEVIFREYAKGVQWQSRERRRRLGEGCTCTYDHYLVNHTVFDERRLYPFQQRQPSNLTHFYLVCFQFASTMLYF